MKLVSLRVLVWWLLVLAALGACSAGSGSPASTRVPATLRMAFVRAQQSAAGFDFASDASGALRSRIGRWDAAADVATTPRGVRVSRAGDGGFELRVETTGVGRDGSPARPGVTGQHAQGQELVLEREDGVQERYLAGPLGLEQSYVLGARPQGVGPLAIEVGFTGLTPQRVDGSADRVLLRDAAGMVMGGYRDLVAVDAEGRELPSHMDVREAGVALVIDDAGAAYPLRIDPMVWIAAGRAHCQRRRRRTITSAGRCR